MNTAYYQQLFHPDRMKQTLAELHWSDAFDWIKYQPSMDYDRLAEQLLQQKIHCFIAPLSQVPLDRNPEIQLAASSLRREEAFYWKNETEIKNLAFLKPEHCIHYHLPIIPSFIQAFNKNVSYDQVALDQLSTSDLAIHYGKEWTEAPLSKLSEEECTPPPAAGVYVMICRKSDQEMRQKLAVLHDADQLLLTNLERQIQKHYHKRQGIEYLGAHLRKDANAFIHGSIALLQRNEQNQPIWRYAHHSQSTSFQFLENILQLLH